MFGVGIKFARQLIERITHCRFDHFGLMGDPRPGEGTSTSSYLFQGDTVRATNIIPYFVSDTAMDDYFIHLLNLASDFSHRFIRFIALAEDLVFRDFERFSQDSEVLFSGCYARPSDIIHRFSHGDSVNTSRSRCDRRRTYRKEDRFVDKNSGIVGRIYSYTIIHQGLILPLYGLGLGCRLAWTCMRCSLTCLSHMHMLIQGFLCRLKTTLKGSSEDIGWLQRIEGLPPVEDGTFRFMEILHNVRNGEHCLPNTLVYLLIPGLFSNHSPLYFMNTKQFFSKMGLVCHIAKIHSEASVEKNAWELKQYIDELYWGSGKRVLLLGHSKGGVDAAAALSIYWDDLKDKVAGLALVQSPYGGSPIASDILREGQIADKEARKIMEFIICKLIKGDMQALEDLTYEKRKDFIARHRLPAEQVPLVSFHTEASKNLSVLPTMSHIAHAELPWLPLPRSCAEADRIDSALKVPVVIPLAAAMAISALHLWLRYGEKSDGLVTRCDAEVPGSVVVRPECKLDHAWMVYSLKNSRVEADSSEMCEALLTLLVEIGRLM